MISNNFCHFKYHFLVHFFYENDSYFVATDILWRPAESRITSFRIAVPKSLKWDSFSRLCSYCCMAATSQAKRNRFPRYPLFWLLCYILEFLAKYSFAFKTHLYYCLFFNVRWVIKKLQGISVVFCTWCLLTNTKKNFFWCRRILTGLLF